MKYIWQSDHPRIRMHIQRHDLAGLGLISALCGVDMKFNRSINAPFALGRPVCKHCLAVVNSKRRP